MAKKEDGEEGQVDVGAALVQMANAIQALAAQRQGPDNDRVEALITQLAPALARLAEAQVEGSKLIADETRRAHRPSNEIAPGISVFNRRGLNLPDSAEGPKKAKLKCLMLLPWLAEWESLTREEVDLLNLLQPGEYVLKRIDNSKVKLTVTIDYGVDTVTPSRLVMTHDTAFNNDNKNLIPALTDMLRQLLRQHEDPDIRKRAALVMSDEVEEALIEAGELTTAA